MHPEPSRVTKAAPAPTKFGEPREPDQLALDAPLSPWKGAAPPPHCGRLDLGFPSPRLPKANACATFEHTQAAIDEALTPLATAWERREAKLGTCQTVPSLEERNREERAAFQAALATDRTLAGLERCATLPRGFVRTLRASLLPDCADTLARTPLDRRSDLEPRFVHALHGLALASRLGRITEKPPAFRPRSPEPTEATRFVEHTLAPWLEREHARVAELGEIALELPPDSQGGATARLALASANGRLLSRFRGVAIPTVWKRDYELRTSFYTAIERVILPHRERLVAAEATTRRAVAVAGLIEQRSGHWYHGLEEHFEGLLAPRAPVPGLTRPELRLAVAAPPALLPELLGTQAAGPRPSPLLSDPEVVAASLHRGGSPAWREALGGAEDPAVLELLARAEIVVAARSADAARARAAADRLRALPEPSSPERDFFLALAADLAELPADPGPHSQELELQAEQLSSLAERSPKPLIGAFAALDAGLLVLTRARDPGRVERASRLYALGGRLYPEDEPQDCERIARREGRGFLSERGCPCPYGLIR